MIILNLFLICFINWLSYPIFIEHSRIILLFLLIFNLITHIPQNPPTFLHLLIQQTPNLPTIDLKTSLRKILTFLPINTVHLILQQFDLFTQNCKIFLLTRKYLGIFVVHPLFFLSFLFELFCSLFKFALLVDKYIINIFYRLECLPQSLILLILLLLLSKQLININILP